MATEPIQTSTRGRPPRVTAERLRNALLAIEGEVPTMASLAAQLEVGVATLYTHVRGQEELRRLAGDVAFDAWELPPVDPDRHWSEWAYVYALDARTMAARYPAVTGARALAGGQLRYAERVLARFVAFGFSPDEALEAFNAIVLIVLGVGAQLAAMRGEEIEAGRSGWDLFQDALGAQPEQLSVLGGLSEQALPDPDAAYGDLVWYTLCGIARRRGETLPADPPRR